ncbi:cysteine desulfurase family protein [Hydrocarboniclastica marina]|uniref:cysteine desulfurase n=1 Tax=Hydrocarboniclastica marina TaxID=2259620 RepID=A0A4P7XMR9_9ALTE|nr:cysteine desulfurase family protein [Hydrocarboniclastica marina]QCF27477.1 cysteine desulfurase [Hydrocarboniclastica marina]
MRVENSIYMDYQATTPVDERVLEEMLPHFTRFFGNPHSSDHALGWSADRAVEIARGKIAFLIGANSEEIVFTSGATESNNHVLSAVAKANRSRRRKLVVAATEHKCVLATAETVADEFGLTLEVVPVHADGRIDQDAYRHLLDEDVLLVAIMAVNNEIGSIQDISMLAALAHEYGALFHCDAAQAPVAIDLDVASLGVDFLSLSAHKIYGPKGVGALYVRSELQSSFPPLIHGGGQQGGLRSGTLPTPLCVGFGRAAEIMMEEAVGERARLRGLKVRFFEGLSAAGVRYEVNGSTDARAHPGNLSIQFAGVDAHWLLTSLQPHLCASTGSACNSGTIDQSYVLQAIGLDRERAASSIRFSLGRFSDEQQVDDAVKLLAAKIASLI